MLTLLAIRAVADAPADSSSSAPAQPKAAAEGQVEEVVVTATRRSRNIQDVPIVASIRGVTQLLASVGVDPPIGVYVDGLYNVLNAGANNAMVDMERVEVLKGPQGALFGRNTIGGAISITTAKPTDKLEGSVQLDGGDYGAFSATAIVNLPIAPGLLDTRLVYQHPNTTATGET
jgi:iron complex outermembrane receptor protein